MPKGPRALSLSVISSATQIFSNKGSVTPSFCHPSQSSLLVEGNCRAFRAFIRGRTKCEVWKRGDRDTRQSPPDSHVQPLSRQTQVGCCGSPREHYDSLVSPRAHQCLVILGCPKPPNAIGFFSGDQRQSLRPCYSFPLRERQARNGLRL